VTFLSLFCFPSCFCSFIALLLPIARELRQESQRLKRTHTVEVHLPDQVIVLVLNNSGVKARGTKLDVLALRSKCSDLDLTMSGHAATKIGNAETTLPVFLHLIRQNS